MANMKSAGVREIILDRCLKERRGYSINELLNKVNMELEFNDLRPVTSGNTIRNDLTNISNRWNKAIDVFKRGHATCYRYRDPSFSIFNGQFSLSEIKVLHSVLLNTKFMDLYQGCSLFQELFNKMEGQIYPNAYEQPILLYENIPDERVQQHFERLYDCIRRKQPISIVCERNNGTHVKGTVHPYFLRQKNQQWHLLGLDEQLRKPLCIPVQNIRKIECAEDVPFIPNTTFSAGDYYETLRKNME